MGERIHRGHYTWPIYFGTTAMALVLTITALYFAFRKPQTVTTAIPDVTEIGQGMAKEYQSTGFDNANVCELVQVDDDDVQIE